MPQNKNKTLTKAYDYNRTSTYSDDQLKACCSPIRQTPMIHNLSNWEKSKIHSARSLINAGKTNNEIRRITLLSSHVIELIRAGAYENIT